MCSHIQPVRVTTHKQLTIYPSNTSSGAFTHNAPTQARSLVLLLRATQHSAQNGASQRPRAVLVSCCCCCTMHTHPALHARASACVLSRVADAAAQFVHACTGKSSARRQSEGSRHAGSRNTRRLNRNHRRQHPSAPTPTFTQSTPRIATTQMSQLHQRPLSQT